MKTVVKDYLGYVALFIYALIAAVLIVMSVKDDMKKEKELTKANNQLKQELTQIKNNLETTKTEINDLKTLLDEAISK